DRRRSWMRRHSRISRMRLGRARAKKPCEQECLTENPPVLLWRSPVEVTPAALPDRGSLSDRVHAASLLLEFNRERLTLPPTSLQLRSGTVVLNGRGRDRRPASCRV